MKHGTVWCLRHGCQKPECIRADLAYKRLYAAGLRRQPLVSASLAQRHLRALARHGVMIKTIIEETGITRMVLWRIEQGQQAKVSQRNHDKIMAVQLPRTKRKTASSS